MRVMLCFRVFFLANVLLHGQTMNSRIYAIYWYKISIVTKRG